MKPRRILSPKINIKNNNKRKTRLPPQGQWRQIAGLCREQAVRVPNESQWAKKRVCLHVAVNLLRFTVSSKQPAQNPHPPHPGYLLRHSGIGSTLSLTCREEKLSPL